MKERRLDIYVAGLFHTLMAAGERENVKRGTLFLILLKRHKFQKYSIKALSRRAKYKGIL